MGQAGMGLLGRLGCEGEAEPNIPNSWRLAHRIRLEIQEERSTFDLYWSIK